jgi:Glycosyltransferase
MRLCIDARMIHSSGIGTFLQNLIPLIAKDPFEVILLSKEPHPNQMSIRFTSPIYSLAEQVFYPWKIPSCDIFWSPHYNAPLLPIQAKRRVVTIHDVCHLAQPFPKVRRAISHFLLQNACKKSDQIVTVSSFSESEIQKYLGVAKEKIQVIYPGVNVQEFSPKKDKGKDPFFLFVGNRKAHKNLATLIKAFEQLKQKNYRLVIVGKKTVCDL